MPNENRKTYLLPKSTGTIPKVKQRNNNASSTKRGSNLLANNLDVGHPTSEFSHENCPNYNRNFQFYAVMDAIPHEATNGLRQNDLLNLSNGSLSTTTHDGYSGSRRNSTGLSKCDNVTKYPDKKQIENKLSQIQEYLHVASSMKTNMKRTDEQCPNLGPREDSMEGQQLDIVINQLRDSETKLQCLLLECENSIQFTDHGRDPSPNELENKVDAAARNLQMLKEQENVLLHLQLNAETQLREAKHAQAKLANASALSSSRNGSNADPDWLNMSDLETVSNSDFRDMDEAPTMPNDRYQAQIDHLLHRIHHVRENNDSRSELIQILDARDAELQAQHFILQGKLQELQTKRQQVDHLVVQLQNTNEAAAAEEDNDEMGSQVKKIVNMKEQLAKLKDMLSLVESAQHGLDADDMNLNEDIEENVNRLIAKTDNLMHQNRVPHVENVGNPCGRRNFSPMSSNEHRLKEKQINKKSMNANENERAKIQAELTAKRKELEELMCKHRAANSNLNHEKNSEHGIPMDSNIFNTRIERVSSESDDGVEDDGNQSNEQTASVLLPMPLMNFPTANYAKRSAQGARIEVPREAATRIRSRSSPGRSFTPSREASNRHQLQKQLELIKRVCDSMLTETECDEQSQNANIRVRNNLTPSPNNNNNNVNMPSPSTLSPNDPYNNFLATNALQTQTFILNTLNQCCQMLWHQQKELAALRSSVNGIQDVYMSPSYHESGAPMFMHSNPCLCPPQQPAHGNSTLNNFRHPGQAPPKMNAANQGGLNASMPNLNGHFAHSPHSSHNNSNLEHACCNNALTSNMPDEQHGNNEMHPNPTAIWNGQALNNQVPPGNRANNYWDNFRSYSRQNLLSTKSNDETQQNEAAKQPCFRIGIASERTDAAKPDGSLNDLPAETVSLENTPRRSLLRSRRVPQVSASSGTKHAPQLSSTVKHDTLSSSKQQQQQHIEELQEANSIEDVNEFVYKEVVSLISANEHYPHFLVQLFRELQHIRSDELRHKTLQSIRGILRNSVNPTFARRQSQEDASSDYEFLTIQFERELANEPNANMPDSSQKEDGVRSWTAGECRKTSDERLAEDSDEQFKDTLSSYFNINADEGIWMDGWAFNVNKPLYDLPTPRILKEIENDNLAEADQSRVVDDEDEGAVGGLLNILERSSSSNAGQIHIQLDDDVHFAETGDDSEQGLDEVPTRLSNPPSLRCSPKSQ